MTKIGWAATHPGTSRDGTCERCGEFLKRATGKVMLELNSATGKFCVPGSIVDPNDSQGGFWFGKRCAEVTLKEDAE